MLTVWLALALQTGTPKTIDLAATSSVWVYSHAGDPTHDQFLRIWGAGEQAVSSGGASDDWSYGYLGWKLADLPDGDPKSAVLILHNVAPGALKPDSDPLQVRALKGAFGDDWSYSQANDVIPGDDKTVFGEGKPTDLAAKPIEIRIKLDKNQFLAYLSKAKASKSLFLALTSKIDPNIEGGASDKGGVYKIYSAAAEAAYRPTLHLEY